MGLFGQRLDTPSQVVNHFLKVDDNPSVRYFRGNRKALIAEIEEAWDQRSKDQRLASLRGSYRFFVTLTQPGSTPYEEFPGEIQLLIALAGAKSRLLGFLWERHYSETLETLASDWGPLSEEEMQEVGIGRPASDGAAAAASSTVGEDKPAEANAPSALVPGQTNVEATTESGVEMSEEPELTPEEIEATRKAFRYKLIEAVESTGWGVQLTGEDIVLGAGRVRLQALPFERVLVYGVIREPDFPEEDVGDLNAETNFAFFVAPYTNAEGGQVWGAFHRLSVPPGVPAPDLGRWLDAQIFDVLAGLDVLDASEPDDEG